MSIFPGVYTETQTEFTAFKVDRSCRVFAWHAVDWDLTPGRDRPKSLKRVVTAPLPNARQQV